VLALLTLAGNDSPTLPSLAVSWGLVVLGIGLAVRYLLPLLRGKSDADTSGEWRGRVQEILISNSAVLTAMAASNAQILALLAEIERRTRGSEAAIRSILKEP
jgi:hypothetical protein